MSLLGLQDYDSESSDFSDKSSSEEERHDFPDSNGDKCGDKSTVTNETTAPNLPLPLPNLEVNKTATLASRDEFQERTFKTSSVFYNPYLAEEKKKISALEQHVHLTKSASEQDSQRKEKKKNICWKFQKGKCKFGDRCKFSHDVGNNQLTSEQRSSLLTPVISRPSRKLEPDVDEDDEDAKARARKRKVGVTDSLVPPKRSLQAYERQKSAERPWM